MHLKPEAKRTIEQTEKLLKVIIPCTCFKINVIHQACFV